MQKSRLLSRTFLFLVILPVSLIGWTNLRAQSQSTATQEKLAVYPSLIVHNGKIAGYGPEIDQNVTFYEAMAVKGDRIWRLGTNQEIRELAGPQTQLIDLKGRTVVPGLIDAHTHPMMWAWNQFGGQILPELEPAYAHGKDVEEVRLNLRRGIQQRIQQQGKDKWIIASVPHRMSNEVPRYPQHGELFPDFKPSGAFTRAELDNVAPDTPVVIISGCCGGVANKRARELMVQALGYEPSAGVRIPYDLIWGVILKGKTAQAADMASREMQNMVNYGVTTSASHGEVNTEYYKALYMLDRQGKMPMRFGWSHEHGFFGSKDPVAFFRLLGNIAGQGSDYLWNVGVGWEGWNATSSQSCLTARPKNWQPVDNRSLPHSTCIPADSLEYRSHLAAVEAGLRLFMLHNNEDKALDRVVAIAEDAIRSGSRTLEDIREQRWNLAHSKWIRPEQIPLIKKYNFAIDFQAKNMVPQVYDVRNFYDPKYLSWTLPAKRLLEAGITFNLSTDTPISRLSDEQENFLNSLPSRLPFRDTMWGVIGVWVQQVTEVAMGEFGSGERRTVPVALGPEQRIDRISALRAATIWGAKNVLREDRLGSLEPGKLADFVIIDKDYFTISEPEIMTLKTLMTVLGGKVAYKDPDF